VRNNFRPRPKEQVLEDDIQYIATRGGGHHDDGRVVALLQEEKADNRQDDEPEHGRPAERRQIEYGTLQPSRTDRP
jgi:hypothetical protein